MAGKTEYKNSWQREKVDRINLVVPKGGKAKIQACAYSTGESVNGFIITAIEERMDTMGVGKRIAPLTDEQIVNRLRGRLRKHGAKIHVISADQCEDHQTRYQILLKNEDPADHVDDESGFYTLSKLVDVVAELDENYFGNKE